MITGFPSQTKPLSEDELLCASEMMLLLKQKVGSFHAMTNTLLSQFMENFMWQKYQVAIKINPARFRKMINHIRLHNLPQLCASDKGYFMPATMEDREKYIESLRERIGAQLAVLRAAEEDMQKEKDKSRKFVPATIHQLEIFE